MGSEEHKSLYDLFREELTAHLDQLEGALAILGDPPEVEHLETLVLAAHSMKGAARIIGLALPADLTAAMEHLLTAVRAGAPLGSTSRQAIADSAVWLRQLEPHDEDTSGPWLATQGDQVRALVARLVAARG